MGRRRNRMSRGLIAALGVAIVLGVVSYVHKAMHTPATARANAAAETRTSEARASGEARAVAMNTGATPMTPVPTVINTPGPAVISTPVASAATVVAAEKPAPTTRPAKAVQFTSAVPTTGPALSAAQLAVPSYSGSALAAAKAKSDAGDLLGARSILNDAMASGKLSDSDTASAKAAISDLNKTIIFSPKRFADDPYGGSYSVQPGDKLTKIAAANNVTWELLAHLNNTEPKKLRSGQTIKIIKGPFHAVVDKTKFTLDLYLGAPGERGSMYVMTYGVGLGKDDSTPTGVWMVEPQHKLRHPTYYSPRGEGVIPAGDPKNPLGDYWIGLSGIDGHAVGKQSYGVHGTIEPDSIGKMASMGCIRMHNEDVAQVYEMLVEGKSTVTVKQ